MQLQILLVAVFVLGCGGVPGTQERLTVYAGASLTDTMTELELAWRESRPYAGLAISTGSSAALRTQIVQGAPADIFLSADVVNAQAVVDAGLAIDGPVVFASNELTVIVPADNPAAIESPADLARDAVRVIAAGEEVPITGYAEQAVRKLAALPGYPRDFVDRYQANVASREDHVAAVVAKITLGEGDAAIVYATDAHSAEAVKPIAIPDETNVVAQYAAVALSRAGDNGAREFVVWLTGPEAHSVLGRFGFTPPQ